MSETSSSALTRRHILASVGVALAGAATSGSAAVPGAMLDGAVPAASALPVSLKHGTVADWKAMVGRSFRVAGGGRVKLVAVEALQSSGARPGSLPRDTAFAAMFEAAPGALEGDRIHRLSHPLFPTLAVHVGPASRKAGKDRLTAVFN